MATDRFGGTLVEDAPQSPDRFGGIPVDESGNDLGTPPSSALDTLKDYGKTFMSGIHTGVGDALGAGVEFAGEKGGSTAISDFGRTMRQGQQARGKEYVDSMSPGGKAALEKPLFEGIVPTGGEGWWKGLGLQATQSLPGMIVTAPVGGAVAKGVAKVGGAVLPGVAGALVSGAASPVGSQSLRASIASQGIRRTLADRALSMAPSAIGYSGAEGALAGLQNAAQTRSEFEAKPLDELRATSPLFRQYTAEAGGDEAAARDRLAREAAGDVAARTIPSTAILGALTGGGALAGIHRTAKDIATGGIASRVAKGIGRGAGQEAIQEFPQSGAEQYIQNLAAAKYVDPTKDPLIGTLSAAMQGAAVGGLTGGLFGAAGGAARQNAPATEHPGTPPGAAPGAPPPGGGGNPEDRLAALKQKVKDATGGAAIPSGSMLAAQLQPTFDEINKIEAELAARPSTQSAPAARQTFTPQEISAVVADSIVRANTKANGYSFTDANGVVHTQEPQPLTQDEQDELKFLTDHVANPKAVAAQYGLNIAEPKPQFTEEKFHAAMKGVEDQRAIDMAMQRVGDEQGNDKAQFAAINQARRDAGQPSLSFKQWREILNAPAQEAQPAAAQAQEATGEGEVAPAVESQSALIDNAAHQAATSPLNDIPQPTPAQIEQGNYKKGHIPFQGLDISIENPAGSTRSGTTSAGKPWTTTMQHHYGYIKGTVGKDKDHVDAFIGPNPASTKVFVVDQQNPKTKFFDEHKVMLGFNSQAEADAAYHANYQAGWKGMKSIHETTMDEFKNWLANGNTKGPYAVHANAMAATQPAPPAQAAPPVERRTDTAERQAIDSMEPAAREDAIKAIRQQAHELMIEANQLLRDDAAGNADKAEKLMNQSEDLLAQTETAKGQQAQAEQVAPKTPDKVPDKKPDKSLAKKHAIARRETERTLFATFSTGDKVLDIAGAAESPMQFATAAKQALDDLINDRLKDADVDQKIALQAILKDGPGAEFFASAYKQAKKAFAEREKEKHRTPEVYNASLGTAMMDAAIGDDPVVQAAFKAGFDHALKGKTKSTLSGENLPAMIQGYEKAKAWIKTPEGNAFYEGKPQPKLKNTGVDLRRWFDGQKRDIEKSSGETLLAALEKATNRAEMFDKAMSDDMTPGARGLMEKIRSEAYTFKDWLFSRNSNNPGPLYSTYGKYFRRSAGNDERIQAFLAGDTYLANKENMTTEEREQVLRDAATQYMDGLQPLVNSLKGRKTTAEIGAAILTDFIATDDERTHRVVLNDAGKEVEKYYHGQLANYRPTGYITNYYQGREADFASSRKASLTPPRLDRVTRDGMPDYRKGGDVTPQQMKDKFGFADVGFGKWVQNKQDQDHLNYAYDAFMDLADFMGIKPKDIGLGGTLHFTIGALGHGRYAAHFAAEQPSPAGGTVPVINVTNTRGDGTVAHEWLHALDSHLRGAGFSSDMDALVKQFHSKPKSIDAITNTIKSFLEGRSSWNRGNDKKNALENALHGFDNGYYDRGYRTEYYAEALKLGADYWGNDREILARAFEAYTGDGLEGKIDDYLVNPNWSGDDMAKPPEYRGRPYPTGEERKAFNEIYADFSKALEWNESGPKVGKEWAAALEERKKERQEAMDILRGMVAAMHATMQKEAMDKEAAIVRAKQDEFLAQVKAADEEKRIRREAEEAAARAAAESQPQAKPDEAMGELDTNDLEALFDQAAAELSESKQEDPTAEPVGANPDVIKTFLAGGRGAVLPNRPMGLPAGWSESAPGQMATNKDPVSGGIVDKSIGTEEWFAVSNDDSIGTLDGFKSRTEAFAALSAAVEGKSGKTAANLVAEAAKLGVTGVDEAMKGLVKLFGGNNLKSFPAGFSESDYKAAKPHFEAALKSFQDAGKTLKDLFKMLIQQFGEGIKPYALRFAKDMSLTAELGSKPSASMALAKDVQDAIDTEKGLTWQRLFELGDKAFGGTQAQGKYTVKDAYDAMEAGVNLYLRQTSVTANTDVGQAQTDIKNLQEMMNLLPTQTKRTAEQDEFQQFSTVPAMAYAVNWVANVSPQDTVLEPSAGIGGLAVFSHNLGAKVVLNELSSRRAALLQDLFPDTKVFHENAEQLHNILPDDIKPTVVIMNPPFSATGGRIQGQRDTMNGARHVEQALKRLEDGGRLVAIVGVGMGSNTSQFRGWFDTIKKAYNIRADIEVNGKGYAKYGTTFDNRILVIDKTGPTTNQILTGRVEDYADLPAKLEAIRNDRQHQPNSNAEPEAAKPGVRDPATQDGLGAGLGDAQRPGAGVVGDLGSGDQGNAAGPKSSVNRPGGKSNKPAGKPGAAKGNAVPGSGFGDNAGPDRGGDTGAGGGAGTSGNLFDNGVASGLTVKSQQEAISTELTDSIFEQYKPQKLTIAGAKDHPGKLVQSSAMASVQPPDATYTPNLPKEVITKGMLSLAQLESVVYAGQAHEQILPSGERKGFFIGDGTGVGKGREIGGIILDNLRRGRTKAVWMSEKPALFNDAKRDYAGVSGDTGQMFLQGKIDQTKAIDQKKGILFTTYKTLSMSSKNQAVPPAGATQGTGKQTGDLPRLKQLVDWLGKDFDGVLVFDEAHNAGNAISMPGKRGTTQPSQQALAVVELQNQLPHARVVYVSATGATELSNLAYASRLGLWGAETPFAGVKDFITKLGQGGLAAMELAARDMKQMGAYISRSLSYDDVTYSRLEHELTPIQTDIYNELAGAWQIVLQNIEAALKEVGATTTDHNGDEKTDPKAKMAAMSKFWGSHQRFFNQVITSMQMPAVLEQMEKDLAAGEAVVLQLVNTNEASLKRELATREEGESLEELDLTPRAQLENYVRNGFPIQQYEDYTDDEGNTKVRPVKDANGNPVFNKEAIAMRDKLLENLKQIRVPDGPLEILFKQYGPDKVAEITGRTTRVVPMEDKDGNTRLVEQSRSRTAVDADAQAFMSDKKNILIFSDAGGTGFSFHADLTQKNQKRRKHYLVQAGWRADKAVQGFGRTHRTNEKSAPHYFLVTTDLPAQKRFISSIARRLDQLGALTRGQRDTQSQGLFSEKDNLESKYAREAVTKLFKDLYANRVPGLDFSETIKQLGLGGMINEQTGALNETKLPEVPQFLNRLLSLTTTMQNQVFNAFFERIEAKINQAIADGTLDVGMETLKSKDVKVLNDSVVYVDPKSKAETKYNELDLVHDTKLSPFPVSDGLEYFTNEQSGKVWARKRTGNVTDASGNVEARYLVMGTHGSHYLSESRWKAGKFLSMKQNDARQTWDAENAKRPAEWNERVHMITGAILPIWDRLPQEGVRVARAQSKAGQRFLGRVILPKDLKETLKRLNVESTAGKLMPREIMDGIMRNNYTAELSNGWTLERKLVSGENRMELTESYLTMGQRRELEGMGVYFERIKWTDRAFIPTGQKGEETLTALFRSKPVVDFTPPGQVSESGTQFSRGAGQGIALRDLEAVKDRVSQGNKNLPPVQPVENPSQAPKDLQKAIREAKAWNTVEGAFHNGKIWLFSDNISSEARAEHVYMTHEITHYGLRGVFGKELDPILNFIHMTNPVVREKAKALRAQFPDLDSNVTAIEEVLADMPSAELAKLKGWHKLVMFVRDWLQAHGFTKLAGELNDLLKAKVGEQQAADLFVANVLGQAREWARNGKPSGTQMYMGVTRLSDVADQTKTPEFKKWFGDSKVVDAEGKPLVVYRGDKYAEEVTNFQPNKRREVGIFLTPEKSIASIYAHGAEPRAVYVSAKKVLDLRRDTATTRKWVAEWAEAFDSWVDRGSGEDVDPFDELQGGRLFDYEGDWSGSRWRDIQQSVEADGYDAVWLPDHSNEGPFDSLVVFHSEQIKSAIGNNGQFDATNPDIRFSRMDSMLAAATPENIRTELGHLFESTKTFNFLHRTVGTQFHKAQINRAFGRTYDLAQAYGHDLSTFANEAADLAPSILPNIKSLRDVFKRSGVTPADIKAASDAVFQGTLDDKLYTAQELADQGLTPKQVGMYEEARKAIDYSLDTLLTSEAARLVRGEGINVNAAKDNPAAGANLIGDAIAAKAAPLRESDPKEFERLMDIARMIDEKHQKIDKLKAQGYAPLSRFGRYTAYVTNAEGESEYFGMYETERARNKAVAALRAEFPDSAVTAGIMSQDAWKLFQGLSPDTMELFADMIRVTHEGQEVTLGETNVFQEYLKVAVNNRSAMKRMIARKNVAGFSTDLPRVLAGFLTSNSRAASGNYHYGDMLDSVNSIPKEQGDVKDEAYKLMHYVQNPQEEASHLRGFLFINYLGGSIASAMVNMTQPILQTFPYLAQWGAGKSAAYLTKGIAAATTGKGIDLELAQALKRAERDGVISPQEIHQLYAEANRTYGSTPLVKKGLTAWGAFFSLAEQFNRKSTFIAAYNLARDENIADPFAFAEKSVHETQGVYNKGNRPDWARGPIGGTVFTFKQFSIAYVEFLVRLPAKQRVLALAILALVGGLQGLPFADDLDDLIDTLAQSLGYNWSTKAQKRKFIADTLGNDFAEFILHGASTLPGVPLDIQGRLGMGNLIPGTAILKKSEIDKTRDITDLVGPVGGLAQSVGKAFGKAQAGDVIGAGTQLLPLAFQNAIKGIDMLQMGMYRDQKGRKVMDTDAYDAFIKGVGFMPSEVAKQSRKIGALTQQVTLTRATEGDIASKWAQGIFEHDPSKIQEAQRDLIEWNRKNPETPIRIIPSQVARRVREMMLTREARVIKSAPRDVRAEAIRELR